MDGSLWPLGNGDGVGKAARATGAPKAMTAMKRTKTAGRKGMRERSTTSARLPATWLVGSGVRLRPVEPSDARPLQRWLDRPSARQWLSELLPRAGPQLAWIAQLATDPAKPSFIIETSLGAQIGLATLSVEGVQAKLGIAIQDTRRVGLDRCAEAVRLLADAAFRVLPLQRIEVRVLPSNEFAVEVYEEAGFSREGVLRKVAFHAGKARDELMLSLLWEEWMARRASI